MPRRSSIVEVKKRLSEKSIARKDVRSVGREAVRQAQVEQLNAARKVVV